MDMMMDILVVYTTSYRAWSHAWLNHKEFIVRRLVKSMGCRVRVACHWWSNQEGVPTDPPQDLIDSMGRENVVWCTSPQEAQKSVIEYFLESLRCALACADAAWGPISDDQVVFRMRPDAFINDPVGFSNADADPIGIDSV